MSAAPQLSVVIPTYGGEASIVPLVERLHTVLAGVQDDFEIVIVNDDSPDDTRTVLERLRAEYPRVVVIDLLHNHGQAMATMCGLAHARGVLVATMDDDLQQPPEELPKLLTALGERPDLDAVVGSWPRDEDPLRNLGSWLHRTVDRIAYDTPRSYRHTTFRLMRRPVVDAVVAHHTTTPVMSPLLLQVTRRVENVPVEHVERPYGRSTFRVRHGIRTVITNLLQGSALPLKLISRVGFTATALAMTLGVFLLVRWFTGSPPPGWTSSLLAAAFFGGATLFAVGLLGEYVFLIVQEVRRPPRWAIRDVLRGGEGGTEGVDSAQNEAMDVRNASQTRSTSASVREL